ncbi:alpha-glucan family phosphorylase [Pollutibacter soli]|uniref:alpha-glucan family phosphorylase n=1 Tax=Pollutibacter soli TaxID=3034157 RepID=UPI003013BEB2
MPFEFKFPYNIDGQYSRRVAYFSMEFAVHQCLKVYAGGLGFLAGSHMRSAYELKQNIVGVGILWKYGYYDQIRNADGRMNVLFQEKIYGFLEKTDLRFAIQVSGKNVVVTAYYLPPEIFHTAPIFFLSTDLPENDYLAQTICHKLYDSNPETRIAADILLGDGGATLLEKLRWYPDIYHLNESHGLPLALHLLKKTKNINDVKQKLRFTNHTPEAGGNPQTNIFLLERMGFFCGIPLSDIFAITSISSDTLNHTLLALQMSGKANAVSNMHLQTLREMWKDAKQICEIISITNAQSFSYWADKEMYTAMENDDDKALSDLKKKAKKNLFEEVADQNGEIYSEDILTIVFAKRFGNYKRPGLLLQNPERFRKLVTNPNQPVQIIWAGKPYPMDYDAIALFDRIVNVCKTYSNCSTLVGYELKLSRLLKQGADIWLNVPRLTHEASGTSGMTAAMNGAINLSTNDGWYPEFVLHGINGFVLPDTDPKLPAHQLDETDADSLYDALENTLIPMYYNAPDQWISVMKKSMKDVSVRFDSHRMADAYYQLMYVPVQV